MQYRVDRISNLARSITNGNLFWLVCKNRNAIEERNNARHLAAASLAALS